MLLKKIFIISGLLLLNLFQASAQQVIDKIVAKVDNQIILQSEVEMAYLQFMRSPEARQMKSAADVKCKVLEAQIINKVLLARAEMDSVTVSKDAVHDQLNRRMDYFVQQFGTIAKLESYYNKSIDQLKEDLYSQIRDQMLIQKMQDNITADVKITPIEVEKFYKKVSKDSLPYFSSEVEVGQIVRLPEINKQDRLRFKQQAEEIRQRIINGEDFCKLANQYSQDLGSAKNCGEIGLQKKGNLVPEYENAAQKLKPGEISEVVETEFGYHIIQFGERRGSEFSTRHILIKPSSSKKDLVYPSAFLDSMRNLILHDSISFQKAAHKYSTDKSSAHNGGMFVDHTTGSTRISQENLDPSIFFIIDTMKIGSITPPIRFIMEDGSEAIRIVYFKSKLTAHQANLKDDYRKIYGIVLEERKNNAVNEWFDKTKSQVYIDIDDEYKQCAIMINQ